MAMKDDLKREFESDLAQLQTLRDEIRVRVHLAGMEMKDQWRKLEPRLSEIEQAAEKATEATRHAAAEALEKFRTFRDSLHDRSDA